MGSSPTPGIRIQSRSHSQTRYSYASLKILALPLARARLAQSAERKALNLVVVGSSPTVGVSYEDTWHNRRRENTPIRPALM